MAHGAEAGGHVAPVLGAVLGAGVIYVAGWRALSRRTPQRFGPRRLAAFLGGLGTIVLAVGSPLDALAGRLLQAHMTQHMLLMMVAPPLLWWGAPVAPMLRGLPRRIRRGVAAGLAAPSLRRITSLIAHPAVGWTSFAVAFWVWHTPWFYELALRSDAWHHVEHACFFTTAMLFGLGFIIEFTIGGLSGIMHASAPVDLEQTDTYFIVAHFHYVLFGGVMMGILAGFYNYFPKITGRMLDERLGKDAPRRISGAEKEHVIGFRCHRRP